MGRLIIVSCKWNPRKEERASETNSNVDSSAQPSVAQLAGRFREQAAVAREKSPSNASQPPKIKVKSSPLIEKLQASLAFDPAALLPGASPKSPGLKAMVSPFHSPPSTPSSPGIRSQLGEAEEVPVSFDQPPEGAHLPSYNKVRTRGSIKRRPPSRRFRRSQSDCGDLRDYRAVEPSQENGAREENGDDVFPSKSKDPGSPQPNQEAMVDGVEGTSPSADNPRRRNRCNSAEKPEELFGTPEEATAGEKAGQNPDPASQGHPEVQEPSRTCSREAENGCGSPQEETAPGEPTDPGKAAEGMASEERAADEEGRLGQKSPDANVPEEEAVREKAPQTTSGTAEGTTIAEQREEAPLEPSRSSGANDADAAGGSTAEIQNENTVSMDNIPIEDTRM
ncbi:capZ-interacting protein isoform X3 [Apodemus sylvaticus]|uniref:capZ-interacting protein isoform X3 n=1 Tax=Apodemus sylvaticus TaxID=10129 RepID=UPI002244E917|nr:capZ-interacting protein isoform X3 [Apodemus sylvaticus]